MNIKKLVAEQKRSKLNSFLSLLPTRDWGKSKSFDDLDSFFSSDQNYQNSGIVFCPHKNWVFGASDNCDEIRNSFPELIGKTDFYHGGETDRKDEEKNFDEVQDKFKNNKLNVLVATKAFGMGIDKPNIRFTAHFNMPQSIESFYQEAGRAGRDRDEAHCVIFYCKTKIDEKFQDRTESISVDKSLMLDFHHNSFRGKKKEKEIMIELLNEINYPESRTLDDLYEYLQHIDLDIFLRIWQKNNSCRLYVNGKTFPFGYGYIDLKNQNIYPENRDNKMLVSVNKAREVLQNILKSLKKNQPSGTSLLDWITNIKNKKPVPGIELLLDDIEEGDTTKVVIGFTNNKIKQITDYLKREIDNTWDEKLVSNSNKFCSDHLEFVKNLKSQFKNRTGRDRVSDFNKIEDKISDLFYQIRDEADTFKAIYRFSVIGIIDDYEVDYRSRTLTVSLSKKSNQEYKELLKKYIGRYVSREVENKVSANIDNSNGETLIQKCCDYLIDFVYEKIASKRYEAINVMEGAIKADIQGGDFSSFVNTYFDSKYTTELKKCLKEISIESVWEYMSKTNGEPDSVQHLNGACDRLLVENPDNPILLLLRSFSRLLIPEYKKEDAMIDFRKGWENFNKMKGLGRKMYLNYLSIYYNNVKAYDFRVLGYVQNEIVKEHTNWTKTFNSKFLKRNRKCLI